MLSVQEALAQIVKINHKLQIDQILQKVTPRDRFEVLDLAVKQVEQTMAPHEPVRRWLQTYREAHRDC